MNKKETSNSKGVRNLNYQARQMNTSENSEKKNCKDLPWWLELLFVQMGLPDKLLIKILKTKKKTKELINKDKKSLITFLFLILILVYFYPVTRHAKNKLDCEKIVKKYILKNKKITVLNNRDLKMLSTNFCYGGDEIYEIKN